MEVGFSVVSGYSYSVAIMCSLVCRSFNINKVANQAVEEILKIGKWAVACFVNQQIPG